MADNEDSRFHRQERIAWWEQEVLDAARVIVVGAGALGNEILKNLALLGVGNILVADFDAIELSNLSRSVLFREDDIGRPKAEVAAAAVADLYPGVRIQAFTGNVVYDLGLGAYRWAQLVICGLDNVEARLSVNRACWKTSRPWIDGGIEALEGQMRMFVPPEGVCYECTMSEVDWKNLNARRSCALLSRGEMLAGRVPTVSTVSSVIAGIQCQEAVKWLHGRSDMAGRGVLFSGGRNELLPVTYTKDPGCLSHVTLPEVERLGAGVFQVRVGDLLELARERLGREAVLELSRDVLRELECPRCGAREEMLTSLGKVTEAEGLCPECREPRVPHALGEIDENCGLLDRAIGELGVPPFDIVVARNGEREVAYFFDGDADAVLGGLSNDE